MFNITVHGLDHDVLTNHDKEETAEHIHQYLQEVHGVHPDGVDIEGYKGEASRREE